MCIQFNYCLIIIEDYSPWGKPGCGAPLANSSGKTVTNVRGSLRRQQQQV